MSNNNRSSNRRRGRGGNRPQGGGNQGNRIDSRARGNAPQLLEKYRKLAHDSALNGDRVQAEYYLQYADHYFRVLADSRVQRDDGRPPRQYGDRDQHGEYEEELEEEGERGSPRREQRDDRNGRERYERDDSERGGERGSEAGDSDESEASDNPFIREDHAPREERAPREDRGRSRRPRRDEPRDRNQGEAAFDASILPPAIGKDDDDEDADRPKKPRRGKPRASDDEQPLEAVE